MGGIAGAQRTSSSFKYLLQVMLVKFFRAPSGNSTRPWIKWQNCPGVNDGEGKDSPPSKVMKQG
jgi:hypothetical protein